MALVQWASQDLDEYNAATFSGSNPLVLPLVSWSPPLALLFKINIDGAIFFAQNAVVVRVIIRDDKGRVEATLTKKGMLAFKSLTLKVASSMCTELSPPPSFVASIVSGMLVFCTFVELDFIVFVGRTIDQCIY